MHRPVFIFLSVLPGTLLEVLSFTSCLGQAQLCVSMDCRLSVQGTGSNNFPGFSASYILKKFGSLFNEVPIRATAVLVCSLFWIQTEIPSCWHLLI